MCHLSCVIRPMRRSELQERKAEQAKELQARMEEQEQEALRSQADETNAAAQVDYSEKQREHAAARVELLQGSIAELNAQVWPPCPCCRDVAIAAVARANRSRGFLLTTGRFRFCTR